MILKALYSAADYLSALLGLMPRGPAWPRDPDSMQVQAYSGLTPSLARFNQAALALLDDAFPATAVNLLPEWEASLGLPDPCLGPSPTIALREAQVVARLTNTGGQSVPFFIDYAAQLGFDITITEFTGSVTLANTWQVNVSGVNVDHFVAGSFAGEYLSTVENAPTVLECEFERLKPAHTILTWNFTPGSIAGQLDFSKPVNFILAGG